MQRDFDLVVTILGTLRDASAASMSTASIARELDKIIASPPSDELVRHHLDLLADAELVKPAGRADDGELWRLTWKGYDALEQEDDEEADQEDDEDDD